MFEFPLLKMDKTERDLANYSRALVERMPTRAWDLEQGTGVPAQEIITIWSRQLEEDRAVPPCPT